jgi:hypothetical protein
MSSRMSTSIVLCWGGLLARREGGGRLRVTGIGGGWMRAFGRRGGCFFGLVSGSSSSHSSWTSTVSRRFGGWERPEDGDAADGRAGGFRELMPLIVAG